MPKKKPTRKKPSKAAPDCGHIAQDLQSLAVAIAELKPDARNARTHSDRNIEAIMASLGAFGQRQPVVANRANGQIEAGHGTVEAARRLGWSHVAVVWVDDDAGTQVAYGVADNRTAERAEWDTELLASVVESSGAIHDPLFDACALADLLPSSGTDKSNKEQEALPSAAYDHQVIVSVDDEATQKQFYERFVAEGRSCKVLTV